MKGLFITIEGIDGAGKSSMLPWLEQRLRSAGRTVLVTREPGGTATGERLREIVLQESLSPESEVLLMFAARKEHLVQVIVPALAAGTWVLCDRFTDATYAYQGGGRGVDPGRIAQLEGWIQAHVQPDLTLLFDLPVETAMQRSAAARSPDRFEAERAEFFGRVREGYLRRARQHPARVRIIDASQEPERVQRQLEQVLP
jgi:dTMP kinase